MNRCRLAVAWACFASTLLILCWVFPRLWYTRTGEGATMWLMERTNVPPWSFTMLSVSDSEERQLAADETFVGNYERPDGDRVTLFTARRFDEDPNRLGLFVHTPDFCWSQVGWQLEPTEPEFVSFEVHRVRIDAERRVFRRTDGHRELVYFFGLVGGRPLNQRLDHNLAIARRSAVTTGGVKGGSVIAGSDRQLWGRLWQAFVERRALLGPKQFIRISTSIGPRGDSERQADERLRTALSELLESVPFALPLKG